MDTSLYASIRNAARELWRESDEWINAHFRDEPFRSVEEALTAGYAIWQRTEDGYIVRTRKADGTYYGAVVLRKAPSLSEVMDHVHQERVVCGHILPPVRRVASGTDRLDDQRNHS